MKELFSVADRIRFFREHMLLSQEDLAQILNVSRPTVNSWESGTAFPEIDRVVNLAKLFNVSTDFILGMEKNTAVYVSGLNTQEITVLSDFMSCLNNKKV